MIEKLSNPKSPMLSHSNILYQVKAGDTISGIAQKMGANSEDNILYDNDLLKGNPKAIQPGMVITFSLLPSGN
jgi:LysM repeat protein